VLRRFIHGLPRISKYAVWETVGVAMRGLACRAVVAFGAAVVLLAPAAGAAARANVAPAAPASAPVPGWSVTPSPNPRAGNGALNTVSCPTTSACTAVGFHVTESGLGVTLAERRTGGAWTVQSTPNPRGAATSALNGVSCPSSSACSAVGEFFVKSGAQRTLAERWNGRRWHTQRTPNPAGSPFSILAAVACPVTNSCTAVGASNSKLLVEQWGGARWRIQSAPVPAGAQFSELNGVSCTAASSCIAVGDYVNGSGLDVTLAERWDGTRWRIQATPSPAGSAAAVLFGVSCTSGSSCMAAGTAFNSSGQAGMFSELWNGATWHLLGVPAPAGAQSSLLLNVSCAVSSCEAVGEYNDSSGATVTLGEGWNGTAWRIQPTPNPGRASGNSLSGVSCPTSSDCTAVGLGNGAGTPITVGERWRGGRWNLEAVPSPVGAAENQLNGIACPEPDACVAVGAVGPTRGVFSTEALGWNGRAWHVQKIPTLPGAGLNGVTCVSDTDCVAVGGSNAGTLAEHWNGEHWTVQSTPNPSGAPAPALNGVSCTAARSCIAVGASFDASGNPTGTFAERWNGARWKLQRTPTQHTSGAILVSVWCTSAAACVATGGTNAGTLTERLNGATWRVLRTPNQPGTQGDFFNSVSCTSLSACTGAGEASAGSGRPTQTLAERWNGAKWRIQPTPLLPGIGLLNNFAAACPAPSACIAAGGFENDGPGAKTLTERWRGGTSTAQTTPGASSPGAYLGVAGCLRAAFGEGVAIGAAATRIGPTIKAPAARRSRPASEIERITSLCSAA
jgi:hypothetical protein